MQETKVMTNNVDNHFNYGCSNYLWSKIYINFIYMQNFSGALCKNTKINFGSNFKNFENFQLQNIDAKYITPLVKLYKWENYAYHPKRWNTKILILNQKAVLCSFKAYYITTSTIIITRDVLSKLLLIMFKTIAFKANNKTILLTVIYMQL